MDYLGEDVEDMRAELRAWRADYRKKGACRGADAVTLG
jgi:hypothetical protein